MTEGRDGAVDPRFDPQFQRGYDPSKHGPRPDPSVVSPPPRPVGDQIWSETAPEPTNRVTDAPRVDEGDDGEQLEPRRNPFRLILLLASILCVGGAALLFWRRLDVDPYGSAYGPDIASTFAYQFTDALMVPLLTGGLLGFCLWLVLGALRKSDG